MSKPCDKDEAECDNCINEDETNFKRHHFSKNKPKPRPHGVRCKAPCKQTNKRCLKIAKYTKSGTLGDTQEHTTDFCFSHQHIDWNSLQHMLGYPCQNRKCRNKFNYREDLTCTECDEKLTEPPNWGKRNFWANIWF